MVWADYQAVNALPANWIQIQHAVLKRDHYMCQGVRSGQPCGFTATAADHILPRFLGGGHEMGNLQALCSTCHNRKSSAEGRQAKALRRPDTTEKQPGRMLRRPSE